MNLPVPYSFPDLCEIRRRAFSLVELLVVIAVLGILAALVVPALPSILGGKGVARAINDASSILELARTEAMSHRTYVYVGFLNATNVLGNSELRIGAVVSLDGTAGTNIKPLTRLLKIQNVVLTDLSGVPQAVRNALPQNWGGTKFINSSTNRVNFSVGSQSFGNAPVVIISPQGEILPSANSASFCGSGSLGLTPTRGTEPQTGGSDGGIVTYYGGSGRIETIRP
jgi:prepilin-type N-terminal cleavage/methylation domain-containing protein